jgi:hypothetical protein
VETKTTITAVSEAANSHYKMRLKLTTIQFLVARLNETL